MADFLPILAGLAIVAFILVGRMVAGWRRAAKKNRLEHSESD